MVKAIGPVNEHPGIASYQGALAATLLDRGLVGRGAGDPAGAMVDFQRALGHLTVMPSRGAEQWFLTACCHAALAGKTGAGMSAAEAALEADAAMSLLHTAVAMDYRSLQAYRRQDAIDPLRAPPDFRILVLDLAMPVDPFSRAE